MTLNRPQIIKRIVDLLGLNYANHNATPAVKTLLNKNSDEKDRNEDSFYYRSLFGSLSCLDECTRPDVSMAMC